MSLEGEIPLFPIDGGFGFPSLPHPLRSSDQYVCLSLEMVTVFWLCPWMSWTETMENCSMSKRERGRVCVCVCVCVHMGGVDKWF